MHSIYLPIFFELVLVTFLESIDYTSPIALVVSKFGLHKMVIQTNFFWYIPDIAALAINFAAVLTDSRLIEIKHLCDLVWMESVGKRKQNITRTLVKGIEHLATTTVLLGFLLFLLILKSGRWRAVEH